MQRDLRRAGWRNQLSFTINAGDYRGRAKLRVEYEKYDEGYAHPFDIYVAIVD